MNKKFYYQTTSMPYVNADPHIGFAMELVQADVLARWQTQQGKTVTWLSGADENSLKNVLAAEKAGVSVAEFVQEKTQRFIDLGKALNVANTDFIRTTESRHHLAAQKLWSACKPEDIYKKTYRGLYCVGCELFYTPNELVDEKCPEHHTTPEEVEEENYFFKLSNYQQLLEDLITSDTYRITPESRKNEALSFIKSGLEDFSISRSQARARNWGVPVPGDESQVMYVWFDALASYLSGIGYGTAETEARFASSWPADVHVIGKGILRFHAVYWPAMLLSAGLELPRQLFVHGYVNAGGHKMSKSLGNVVDPFALIEKYGVEPVRYYLLRSMHPYQDSDFSEEHLVEVYTADLANGLGNLVSRVAGMIEQYQIEIPKTGDVQASSADSPLAQFRFDQALEKISARISEVDQQISNAKPWELMKAGQRDQVATILINAVQILRIVANALEPILPETAEKIQTIFSAEKIVKPPVPLFPRIESSTAK